MFGVLVMLFIIFVLEETLPRSHAKKWSGWGEFMKDVSPLGYRPALRLWCCPFTQHVRGKMHTETVEMTDQSAQEQGNKGEAGNDLDQAEAVDTDVAYASEREPEEEIVRRARVLRVILVVSLLSAFGSGVFALSNNVLLGALHYKQEELVFLGVFSKIVAVPSGLLAAALLPSIGCYCAWVGGLLLAVVGFGCFTTLGYYGPYVCFFIWTVAFAFIKPAVMVFLSIGLRKEDQAKGIATLAVLDILPAAFAPAFFTAVFFDPNSTQTTAFMLAGALFLLTALIVAFGLPRHVEIPGWGSQTTMNVEPGTIASMANQERRI